MQRALISRRLTAAAAGAFTILAMSVSASAHSPEARPAKLGFTPITTNALSCAANGLAQFANNSMNQTVTPKVLMTTGDSATPVNAPASSIKVGAENDMIALDENGKYLFTPSESGVSDGITRLTLKGKDAGKKEVLAQNVSSAGTAVWSRIDGIRWYPYGGPESEGMLLISEEFAAGGVWQVNPMDGSFARLDWLGNYAHEGIGIDAAGNLYLGDEARAGAIYKGVPKDPADLTKGGVLSYMVGTGVDASGWKAVKDPAKAATEASAGGAVLFDRPEDFDERNGRIYFAVTEPASDSDSRKGTANQVVNRGGIYSFAATGVPSQSAASGALPYAKLTPMIEVNDPKYTNQADAKAQQGLQFPDNIAFDGKGNLWVHEDIPDNDGSFPANGVDVSKQARDQQDELYVYVLNEAGDKVVPNPATTGPGVSGGYKAADMRTSPKGKPCENEFSGGIFGEDGKTLFINQQHWDNPTLTIRLK